MFCALSWHCYSQFTILQLRKINRSQTNPCQQIHVFVEDFRLYIHACLLNDMMPQWVEILHNIVHLIDCVDSNSNCQLTEHNSKFGAHMKTTYLLLSSCYPIVLVFSSKNVIHAWSSAGCNVVGNGQILIIITSRLLKPSNYFINISYECIIYIRSTYTPPYLYE